MKKDFRQMLQRLVTEGVVVAWDHGSKHDLLTLANGRRVCVARTPSDYRGMLNALTKIRHAAKA